MSSEPQVTSSAATQNSIERVLTRWQADLLPVYDVVGRRLHREPAFLHEHEPERHLEELALMTALAALGQRGLLTGAAQDLSALPTPPSTW